ncbi:MAG: pilus assembly protein PilP, partial [Myxococcales bacterium]|nr:pilus assembly protein PilP [Myxococcales bacterium]
NAPDPSAATTEGTTEENAEEEAGEIPYAYSPIGSADPFRNLFDVEEARNEDELTELQRFELDQLRLVAVVSRIATPYAMVEDPQGKGHTLTRGTLIGKNWGQVAQIREDCVVVREEYRDYTGRKVTNRTSLCLPKPEDLKLD